MDYLLDTHTLIWSITEPKLLPEKSRTLISNPDNKCFVSIVSLWEIAIKYSLGRLEISGGLEEIFKIVNDSGFEILPLSSAHILGIAQLPFHHRDPFDRIIIAQCQSENIAVVSKDKAFSQYNVLLIWD